MNPGILDQKITLQPLTATKDTDGTPIVDYTQNNVTVYANYLIKSGKEFYAAQKMNTETQAAFKIRYRSGIDTTWRVKFGSRIFDILFIDDSGMRKGEMLIVCKEVV